MVPAPTPPPELLARAAGLRSRLGPPYPADSHWLQTDAGWLHHLDEGPPPGEAVGGPVLCVHGNPTWSWYFRHLVDGLRGRRRVLAVDHIGCGLSEKPQDWPYRLAGHVDNLERLVLERDLTDLTLVLHDWGGAIGMGVAVRHPERIGRVVLGNTAAFHLPRIPKRIAVCRWPIFGPLALRGFGAFSRAAVTQAVERPMAAGDKRAMLAPYGSWHDRIAQLRFVQDIPLKPDHPTWETLAGIDAGLARLADTPMAIHWGMGDWCFTPHFLDGWLARFPDAEVTRHADAGHYLLEDAHEVVVPAIAAWLDRVEGVA